MNMIKYCIVTFLIITFTSICVAQEWVARYNGPGNGSDRASAIAVDAAGNVYVIGHSVVSGTASDYVTVKYDSLGIEQWVARYNGTGNDVNMAYAVALDNVGNIYVTGMSWGSGTNFDYATIKYNSSGIEQWVARYNGTGNGYDSDSAIAVDAAGNVYVTGYSMGSGSGYDYATVKYDSSGVEQWVARYNGPGNDEDRARSIAINNTGDIYITGWSVGIGTGYDYATVKYNSSGVEQWVVRYNGPMNDHDFAHALDLDNTGGIHITGCSMGDGTASDYVTIKYNSSGTEMWEARYNGTANAYENAYAIAVDAAHDVYVTGRSPGLGTEDDYATVKYDSFGVEQWVARYNGPSNEWDEARAIATDTAGNVYVTGYSMGSGSGYDYATVKYDSSGVEQWVARYNGPGNGFDGANAITVDNIGYIYVTGASAGSGSGMDFATIKYAADYRIQENRQSTHLQKPRFLITPTICYQKIKILVCNISNNYYNLYIYNILGNIVKTFHNASAQIAWNGCDDSGNKLPNGVYFVTLKLGTYTETKKVLLIN